MKKYISAGMLALALPETVLAQDLEALSFVASRGAGSTFEDLVIFIVDDILNPLIVLIIALALIYFLWGMANFILHADDEQARSKGKQVMVWGIIALFVMVSVWTLVKILQNTFFGGSSITIFFN